MEGDLLRVESDRPLSYLEQVVVAPDPDMSWRKIRERLKELYEDGRGDMGADSSRSAGP